MGQYDEARTESDAGAKEIAECGCRPGTFLAPAGNSTAPDPQAEMYRLAGEIGSACSNPSDGDFLLKMGKWEAKLNSTCCKAGLGPDCNDFEDKLCLWQACRLDYVHSATADTLAYGKCEPCPEFATCSGTAGKRRLEEYGSNGRGLSELSSDGRGLSERTDDWHDRQLIYMGVRPGYWRSSPLSGRPEKCITKGVCIGSVATPTDHLDGTRDEWLCLDGHIGPLCEKCQPYWYKNNDNLCFECDNRTRTHGIGALVYILNEDNTQARTRLSHQPSSRAI